MALVIRLSRRCARLAATPQKENADFETSTHATPSAPAAIGTTMNAGGGWLPVFIIACFALSIFLERKLRRFRFRAKRRRFIETYVFPPDVLGSLQKEWPEFRDWQVAMTQRALRSFFIAHLDTGPDKLLAMPSKAADALWHAFILDTIAYHDFCERAFGRYFHHRPESRMPNVDAMHYSSPLDAVWRSTCNQAGIDPRAATRLPILFEVDRMVRLPDARRHDPVAMSRRYHDRHGRFDFVFEIDLSGCGGSSLDGDGGDSGSGDGGCGGGCGGD